ncbi:hypothetical protein KJ567_06285 [Candidatus Bipolaricaulota bacterium]|nr:hypothetical protein [Candidatus Bipolaricaulota bacterium]
MHDGERSEPKRKKTIEPIRWFFDRDAEARGEPGLRHSFIMSLATTISHAGYVVDPVWVMGASGFAFRIWIEQRLQPSAMNLFDWPSILPSSVERIGFDCTHVWRDGAEDDIQKGREAHATIVESIDRGIPAVVWDPTDPPLWHLIRGYNDHTRTYDVLSCWRHATSLPYEQLGHRDVEALSVITLGTPNGRDEAEAFLDSLRVAVAHAEQREGSAGPVTDGLAAFELWARLIEPGGLPAHDLQFADYFAATYRTARCYARDYVARFAAGSRPLGEAAVAYAVVAEELRPVWETFRIEKRPLDERLEELAAAVRRAGIAERTAIAAIKRHLASISD